MPNASGAATFFCAKPDYEPVTAAPRSKELLLSLVLVKIVKQFIFCPSTKSNLTACFH